MNNTNSRVYISGLRARHKRESYKIDHDKFLMNRTIDGRLGNICGLNRTL